MEALILLGLLVVGFILVGSIVAFTNLSGLRGLRDDVKKLKHTVNYQRTLIEKLLATIDDIRGQTSNTLQPNGKAPSPQNAVPGDNASNIVQHTSVSAAAKTPINEAQVARVSGKAISTEQKPVAPKQAKTGSRATRSMVPAKPKSNFTLDTFLMGNGLLWLGAIVLALGGVFLAKYSIEAGLFPPSLRIIIGACFGVILVCAAEYLFRHPARFQINSTMISAALASGGVITCFAMTLVAFDFYSFLSPLIAFIILAFIATSATWMSVRYGPILALVGVVGAYTVPALVSTGSNNIFALLIYVSFVSVSTLWVHAYVKQSWLWWLSVLGHFGWLFISLAIGFNDYQWVIFSYCLLSIYLFVLAPILGFTFKQAEFSAMSIKSLLMPRKEQLGIVLPIVALIVMNAMQVYSADMLVMLSVLSAVLLFFPFRHSAFDSWPFLALGLCVLVYLKMPVVYDYTDNLFPFTGGYIFLQTCAAGFIVYSMFALQLLKQRPSFLLLLVFAPMLLMGLGYALSTPEAEGYLYPVWAIELMLLACIYAYLGTRVQNVLCKMTYLMLANGALTLTFTMLLSAATLSLAIVAQIALMAFLSNKFKVQLPHWLYKIAVAAVLLRLTAAPWLPAYLGESIAGVHWSLIVYPLVFVLFYLAYKFQQSKDLKAWFMGALLHVVALFVTTETSFLLYGSYPNLFYLSYHEAILLSMNWLILGAVYLWRKQYTHKPILYVIYSTVLIAGSALLQTFLSVLNNPFVSTQNTGTGVFFNWLIPLWAIPAIVIGAMLYWRLIPNAARKLAWGILGVFFVLYINGFIRGLYHPGLSFWRYNISQQELYVYSIVWLFIAVAFIVFAQTYSKALINKIGFSVLALVVLKAFIIDLANLDGLYRALSFIGLGLSLVGIGWLFQRFRSKSDFTQKLQE